MLRVQQTDGLTPAWFLTSTSERRQGTSTANLVTIWPLNHLLPSPTAGLSFYCWPHSPSLVLPGLFNNENQTGSLSQGCLYAKKGRKHKSGQQTCKCLIFIPSILLASFSSLIFLPSLPCSLETHLIVTWDDKCPLPQCPSVTDVSFLYHSASRIHFLN